MHTLNPFESRSYNSKVTNWRILELRGLKVKLSFLLRGHETLDAALNAVDEEIEHTKKAYADYLKNRFGQVKNSTCPYCLTGVLKPVAAVHPYSLKHLQCNVCDSTYKS